MASPAKLNVVKLSYIPSVPVKACEIVMGLIQVAAINGGAVRFTVEADCAGNKDV
jgi:hypothetical protein